MSEKIYPEGLRFFNKKDSQPDFVIGSLIITPRQLTDWIKANPSLLTEYNEQKQLKLQILKGDKGMYSVVDTYKPKTDNKTESKNDNDDLPF